MLILTYIAEGIVRAMTERGMSQTLATIECVLGFTIFVSAIAYVRIPRSFEENSNEMNARQLETIENSRKRAT